jgi:hypothetical protein
MSNTPVISVEVNDQQFRGFYELFQKYAGDVEEMPADWKRIGEATGSAGKAIGEVERISAGTRTQLAAMAAQADAIGKAFSTALDSHTKFASSLRESNTQLEKMASTTQKLGGGVFGAMGHVAGGNGISAMETAISTLGNLVPGVGKIVALIGGIGAAAMIAGKKLADDAVGNQRNARRVGVSTGQLRSFDLNFGRYADPSILNRAADAQSDMTMMPYAMLATGKGISQLQSEGADDVAIQMMQRAHDWWNKTPASMRNQQTLTATGLNKFMSFEDVRQLGAMTDKEFAEARTNYKRNASQFDVSGKSTDALYGFSRGVDEKTTRAKAALQEGGGKFIDFLTGNTPKQADDAMKNYAKETRALTKDVHNLRVEIAPVKRDKGHPLGTIAASRDESLLEAAQILGGARSRGTPAAAKAAGKIMGVPSLSMTAEFTKQYPGLAAKAGPEAVRDALESQMRYGVPAAVTLAQYGLESGYGSSGLFKRSNNPFGMQAAAGQDYVLSLDHHADGAAYQAKFRRFRSLAEAFDEHAKLLAHGRAYAEARNHLKDPIAYANSLTGHYAEDPHYGQKLIGLMHQSAKNPIARGGGPHVKVTITNHTAARVAVSTNAAATGS